MVFQMQLTLKIMIDFPLLLLKEAYKTNEDDGILIKHKYFFYFEEIKNVLIFSCLFLQLICVVVVVSLPQK